MDEPWVLRIKIHVLLNCWRYREKGEHDVFIRCPICEVCGLGFGIISRSTCKCSSKKKKKASFWLIRLKGIQDCSISQSREQTSFISDIFLGLHLWRISLIYLLAPCGCVPEAAAQEWKPPSWAADFSIFPSSISRSTGFHCS